MTRAYADVVGNFRRGEAGAYARGGDYRRASDALAVDDPEMSEAYRRRAGEEEETAYRRGYGSDIASGNYDAAIARAGKTGDVQGVAAAREGRTQADEQQRIALWRGAQQNIAELEAIDQAQGQGYEDYLARAQGALAQNPNMDPEMASFIQSLPPQWNPRVTGAARMFVTRLRDGLLTPEQAAQMEIRQENQANEGWALDAYGRPYQMQGGVIYRRNEAGERVADTNPVPVPRDRVPAPQQNTYGPNGLPLEQIRAEQAFADDWRGVYNNWSDIRNEMGRLDAAFAENTSAGDLALVVGFTKMLDPGSVAREGEVALTQSAASVLAQVQNLPAQWQQGRTRLPPVVRQQLIQAARSMYGVYQSAYSNVANDYRATAESYGFDPNRVMMGYRDPRAPATDANAEPDGAPAAPPQRPRNVPPDYVWNAEAQSWDPPN